jgi:hypothetical protein
MWVFLAIFAVALVASFALAPKPQSLPRPELEDLQAPTAEEGREIPVLFGCRDIRGPNVVWYGDLRTVRIKAKAGKK